MDIGLIYLFSNSFNDLKLKLHTRALKHTFRTALTWYRSKSGNEITGLRD